MSKSNEHFTFKNIINIVHRVTHLLLSVVHHILMLDNKGEDNLNCTNHGKEV